MKFDHITYLICFALGLIVGLATTADATPKEQRCFDRIDSPGFVAPDIPARFKIRRGLRGCTNFACLAKRAGPSRKRLVVFVAPRIEQNLSRGNWGNLGWARQNVAIIQSENQLQNALKIAKGINYYEIGDAYEEGISLRNHNSFVAEIRCLRRAGFKETSFNEVQPIP